MILMLRRLLSVSFAFTLTLFLSGCATPSLNGITQVATIGSIQTVEKAKQPGDTLNRPAGLVRLLTEKYEPLNYTENGTVTGLSVEVVREMSKFMQGMPEIKVVDWADGYQMALQGPDTALFSTAMTSERKNLFKWIGPLATSEARFYALKGTALSLKTLEDARAVKVIATVKDTYLEQELSAQKFTNLVTCKSGAEAVHKVLNGEAIIMPYNNIAMSTLLKQLGYPADALVPVYTVSVDPVYLAFSKDVSDAVVKEWQDALDLLKNNGTFERIYTKWLPHETPPGILQFLTEDYPPLTFKQAGEVTGLATDIVKEICSRNNFPANIQMTPWSSAYAMALVNPNVLLFSAERTEPREKLFNWVGPLGQNTTIFYARKGAGISVKSLDDAKQIKAIGTTTEWFSEQYLQGQGFRNLKSSLLPSATIKKLMEGEVDLAVFTDITIPEIVKNAGYNWNDIEPVYVIMKSYFYIAVSLGTPVKTVSQWQKNT